jgi:hypothetical protein
MPESTTATKHAMSRVLAVRCCFPGSASSFSCALALGLLGLLGMLGAWPDHPPLYSVLWWMVRPHQDAFGRLLHLPGPIAAERYLDCPVIQWAELLEKTAHHRDFQSPLARLAGSKGPPKPALCSGGPLHETLMRRRNDVSWGDRHSPPKTCSDLHVLVLRMPEDPSRINQLHYITTTTNQQCEDPFVLGRKLFITELPS